MCDNCGQQAARSELTPAKDLFSRLEPGGIFTDVECPDCGALCYPGGALDALTPSDMVELLEVARISLACADTFDYAAEEMDVTDSHLQGLRNKLQVFLDGEVTNDSVTPRRSPFWFEQPEWVNTGVPAANAEEALKRAQEIATAFYPLGTQCGVHSMIEWCGVMSEHVKMLQVAVEQGVDPREVDQHHAGQIPVPGFMVEYLTEKLGCQLKPFIRADAATWRAAVEGWFEGRSQVAVCEVIDQRPHVTLLSTMAKAIECAATLACENLRDTSEDRDGEPADMSDHLLDYQEYFAEHDDLREGDYEIYILKPSTI